MSVNDPVGGVPFPGRVSAIGSQQIIAGVLCQNLNRIVRSLYLGFSGDFIWLDTQGTTDPIFTGLGSRYILVYLDESDLAGEG